MTHQHLFVLSWVVRFRLQYLLQPAGIWLPIQTKTGRDKTEENAEGFLLLSNAVCCMLCLVTQPCLTLCNPLDCSPSVSAVHVIFKTRILEWVVISSSRESFQPKVWTDISCVSSTVGGFLTHWATSPFKTFDDPQTFKEKDRVLPYLPTCTKSTRNTVTSQTANVLYLN